MSALNGLIERMNEKVGPLPVIGWIAIGGIGFAVLAARSRAHAAPAGGSGTVTLAPGDTTNGVTPTADQSLAGILAALKSAGATGSVNISLPGGGSAGFELPPPEPPPNPAPLPDSNPPPPPPPTPQTVPPGTYVIGGTQTIVPVTGGPPGLGGGSGGALIVGSGGGGGLDTPPGGIGLAPPPSALEIHPPIIGNTTAGGGVPLDIGPGGSLG